MTLKLDQVSKKVGGAQHLYPLDLELKPGLNVLIGPTLAGKTSLMRLMAGLDKPSSGRILMDGREVTDMPIQKRSVAMVYQQFINYPSFTVYDNLASPLRLAGLAKAEIERRVREMAALLHLEPYLERLPGELSGGQQQRTAMARALIKDASLLLFDEPLVNLDYKLREELRAEMREIFQRRQAVVVYATTEPLEALLLGGASTVLDAGRVLQHGPTLEVYHRPATVRAGQIFSDPPMNTVLGKVEDGMAWLGEQIGLPLAGHLTDLAPGRYRFGVRANHLFIAPGSAEDVAINAVTQLAEVNGSETFIHITHHDGTYWVVQEEGVHSLGLGKEIQIYVHPRHLFVYDEADRLVAAPRSERRLAATPPEPETRHGAH
ncbi:MAG: ABC transporter ATP-binding protein [Gammaproteobacteria bacterium]|nr:ABC transporter ATP-binding protein [Gammaproteobacteria bacterium]MCP5459306.1 ABC transporter ATP-binding protein [Gammaproteobacteria bacterium]